MGDISKRVADTLQLAKSILKKLYSVLDKESMPILGSFAFGSFNNEYSATRDLHKIFLARMCENSHTLCCIQRPLHSNTYFTRKIAQLNLYGKLLTVGFYSYINCTLVRALALITKDAGVAPLQFFSLIECEQKFKSYQQVVC